MSKYKVKGEEGSDVDVFGTIFKPGDVTELQDDVAAPLVEAGTVELVSDEEAAVPPAAESTADVPPSADAPVPPAEDGQG